jgi:PleD family two-component response regulator
MNPAKSLSTNIDRSMNTENIPIKILIIDDDEEDFFLTSQYIKKIRGKEFIIDWCYRYKEALRQSEARYTISLIIIWGQTGLELMKTLWRK